MLPKGSPDTTGGLDVVTQMPPLLPRGHASESFLLRCVESHDERFSGSLEHGDGPIRCDPTQDLLVKSGKGFRLVRDEVRARPPALETTGLSDAPLLTVLARARRPLITSATLRGGFGRSERRVRATSGRADCLGAS